MLKQTLIRQILSSHIISYSQGEAGFKTRVNEEILFVKMNPLLMKW